MARHIAKSEKDLPRVRLYRVGAGWGDDASKARVTTFEVIATSQGLCRVSDDGVRIDKPLAFDFGQAAEKGYSRSFAQAKKHEAAKVVDRIDREAKDLANAKRALAALRSLKAPK